MSGHGTPGALRGLLCALCMAVAACLGAGCTATPPRYEVMEYDGGMVIGDLQRGPARFTVVSIADMASPMAKATTIRLFDGVPVSMAQVTPEFLLARGRVFVPRRGEGAAGATPDRDESAFREVAGLSSFDPDRIYFVIVGPAPDGPFYRFDVMNGRAVRFGTQWPGGFVDDGKTLMPGAVFVDSRGGDHEMPLTRADVEEIWGAPLRTLRVRPPER